MNCQDVHSVPYIRAISTMKADYLMLTLSAVDINLGLLVLRVCAISLHLSPRAKLMCTAEILSGVPAASGDAE